MLQSVRWLFRTLSTERKALITLQDRLLQEGVLPAAPGRTHKLNHPTNYILCRYLFSAGGDDWVMDFTNSNLGEPCGDCSLINLVRYPDHKEPATTVTLPWAGQPQLYLTAPPEWW